MSRHSLRPGLRHHAHRATGTSLPLYLLRDEFTTARAEGTVNGTPAEPGPGTRIVNDPDSLMLIVGGALSVTGPQAVTNQSFRPGLAYAAIPRSSISKVLAATVTPIALRGPDYLGFLYRPANNESAYSVRFVGGSIFGDVNKRSTAALAAYTNGVTYNVAIILHAAGGEIWIKGGAFTAWTQLHTDASAAQSIAVFPAISFHAYNVAAQATVDFAQLCIYGGGDLDRYFDIALPGPGRNEYNVLLIGDSKGVVANAWKLPGYAAGERSAYTEIPTRIATSGWTVALCQDNIDAELAARSTTPAQVWINLGANDVASLPAEATWKSDLNYILDALHTKWADTHIYLARPWRRSYGTQCDTLATWIADIVGERAAYCHLGMDERVWLENGDDGVTYTTDGVHYTASAYDVAALQWRAAVG